MDISEEEARRTGQVRREFFSGREEAEIEKRMDQRLGELNRKHRETFVGRKKIGRNDKCPCGSGRKFKKCCITGLRSR